MESGSLKVTWAVATLASSAEQDKPAEETKVLRLRWIEQGGPPPPHPITPSLGTQLVRGFASRELKGFCELRYRRPEPITCWSSRWTRRGEEVLNAE